MVYQELMVLQDRLVPLEDQALMASRDLTARQAYLVQQVL